MFPLLIVLPAVTIVVAAALLFISIAENQKSSGTNIAERISTGSDFISGPASYNGSICFPETVEQIMERDKLLPHDNIPLKENDLEERINYPDRKNLPQNPESKAESTYPPISGEQKQKQNILKDNPQTVSTNFTGIQVSEAGFVPADNMGAVGPTQFIFIANGRIKTFSKATGTADGVLNTTTDNFFNSVRNGSGTSDPRIRYDRMTQRWFVVIINVSSPNRILISVSNSSSITAGTIWTSYFIDASAMFLDYPTLGIDNNALYIGTNNFNTALTSFLGTNGYVINKAGLLVGSLTFTQFALVPTASSAGPYTPQGVDNFDASATEGYFIGVDNLTFGTLMIRRVSNPGGSPSISSNISLTVSTTVFPINVPHQGMTGTRLLDALDDRLFAACIRNGALWTAHNIQVNSSGVASTSGGRDGSRWYTITNLTGVPALVQSGTIFDPAASNPLSYWIPTVMVSGQGHAAFIFSSAGSNAFVNVSTAGRLVGDVLGTTQSVTNVTSSSTSYNLQVTNPQRWGDYSYVSLDPNDDMTMWGVEGFCNATNSWGENASKLLAPPPPPLTSANPPSLTPGQPSVNVIITGTPTSLGEGFYDPGSGFPNHISSAINGGVTVNSTTYNSPTQVTLNISTVGATTGSKTVTITNPDGQSVLSSAIFQVPLPVALSSFNSSVDKRDVTLMWSTTFELNNKGFDIERKKESSNDWSKIGFMPGHGTTNDPQDYNYRDTKLETGKYNYRLKQIDYDGTYERYYLNNAVNIGVPLTAEIFQNYPNPFNPMTKIDYSVTESGTVKIQVFDVTGREVGSIVNESKPAGYYTAEFNGSNLASGIYFYRINVSGPDNRLIFSKTMKMLVVK